MFGKPLAHVRVVSGWGDDRSYRGEGSKHEGVDLSAAIGDPVYAVDDGVVQTVNNAVTGPAGLWIRIKHPSGFSSEYLHLSSYSVSPGQEVARGDQIGRTGQTSTYSIPPHLHFQTRIQPGFSTALYSDAFGTPAGGFGHSTASGGLLVPSEPLVPVDRYDSNVISRAALRNIPLFGAASGLLSSDVGESAWLWAGGAVLAWWLWRKKRS